MLRFVVLLIMAIVIGACTSKSSSSSQSASRSAEAYCPYLPSRTFDSGVTISGRGVYEYRVSGNGAASDSGATFTVNSFSTAAMRTYSVELNGRTYTATSSASGLSGQQDVITQLKNQINADASTGLLAYGISTLTVSRPLSETPVTVGATTLIAHTGFNADARPIRSVEIAVKDEAGTVVQCAETATDGSFRFQLPSNSGNYRVEIRSRANNALNTAYVLNSPDTLQPFALTTTVSSSSDQSGLYLRARVANGLLGGAFNIIDQIWNAQNYLRQSTAGCDQPGQPNSFDGCKPFTAAPLVTVYWAPGVSPGIYVGISGAISFYLNGLRELYLQGGSNGNVASSDMDHFDNSVILHEYAHFLEDVFGKPNSPGGSHTGNSIIDPRLAWGEGWANFFQAAVTGIPVYRDTYGTPDCYSACAGAYFNEDLDPAGAPAHDAPTVGAMGEGNFREFSVSRALWGAIKPLGVTGFAEIWRAFVQPLTGMREIDDPFKSIGRLHAIQASSPGATDWSLLRSKEEQVAGLSVFASPLALGTCSPQTLTPRRAPGDNGSFASSDLFRSNRFYRLNHAGGPLQLELFYTKPSANAPDLDFYLYRRDYAFGEITDIAMSSGFSGDGCPASGNQSDSYNPYRAQNGCPSLPTGLSSPYGYERTSGSIAAGTYMLNVFADTAIRAGAQSQFVLLLNGQALCPQE